MSVVSAAFAAPPAAVAPAGCESKRSKWGSHTATKWGWQHKVARNMLFCCVTEGPADIHLRFMCLPCAHHVRAKKWGVPHLQHTRCSTNASSSLSNDSQASSAIAAEPSFQSAQPPPSNTFTAGLCFWPAGPAISTTINKLQERPPVKPTDS